MAGGRKQAGARVPNEGGPAKPGVKGKNFNRAEEEQLCRSVLFVLQDRIMGNQQRAGVFWERITEHYDEHRPDAPRPQRSLETKWGLIKHDVSSFCGVYAQVLRLNKSGTSAADTLRHSRELYRQKSPKKQEFCFEHCWALLKDHPKWMDGWTSPKASSSVRSGAASGNSPAAAAEDGRTQFDADTSPVCRAQSEVDAGGSARGGIARPGGSKGAREDSRSASAREGAIYAQADATRTMAAAQMKKAALLEDQNMLLLMTMPDDKITTAEAREYLRMRRCDELKKLRRKLAHEEERERLDAASESAERSRSSATKRRRHQEGGDEQTEGEGSQRVRGRDGMAAGLAAGGDEQIEGEGSQGIRGRDGMAAGLGAGVEYGEEEGTASQAAEEDAVEGDGDYCVSLAEGGREQRGDGEGGYQLHGRTPAQEMGAWEHNHRAGMWAQPHIAPQAGTTLNTEGATSFNRSWLDMNM